ncbi:MAG: hypothetical protein ACJ72E_12880 [Marmoricola sp.]
MTSVSRSLRPALVSAVALVALTLSGCGSGSGTKTAHDPVTTPVTTPTSTSTASGNASGGPTPPVTSDGHAHPGFQLVSVKKYGISYEVPKGWISLSASGVLTKDSPVVKLLSEKLGQSPDSIVQSMRTSLLAMSVSDHGAVAGFLENVNAAGSAETDVTDDLIRLQLARIGAKPTSVDHVDSPIGRIVRVPYGMSLGGHRFNGVMLGVASDDGYVTITISSHDAASAGSRADQVQRSLALLPGGGGTLS